jgi:hypothetical protein
MCFVMWKFSRYHYFANLTQFFVLTSFLICRYDLGILVESPCNVSYSCSINFIERERVQNYCKGWNKNSFFKKNKKFTIYPTL